MPFSTNFIERLIFLDLNIGPGPLMDVFTAVGFRGVWAATRLGVFDALEHQPQSVGALAKTLGTEPRATGVLLRALDAMGYVERKSGGYSNTAMTRKWMLPSSPISMARAFDFWGTTLATLGQDMEGAIRAGKPAIDFYPWLEDHPDTSAAFQHWLMSVARTMADEIATRVKLPNGAVRLLDAGGGHGYFSIAFCRKHRSLTATVRDFPAALDVARRVMRDEQMEDRVLLEEGDLLRGPFGGGYDAVLLFNVIHGHEPAQNLVLLEKAAVALNPGGRVVILDQLAGRAPTAAITAISDILALGFFHLCGTRTYSFKEISGWLGRTGFSGSRQIRLFTSPGSSVVIATKR